MRKLIIILIAAAFILSANAISAQEGGANILFIFDASGSMEHQIEGKTKLNTAREVLSTLVTDLPEDANVGLLVYGNGEEKACESIELAVPVSKRDVESIKSKLNSLQAKGWTPIAGSLLKGAEVLQNVAGNKTIVLISDGEETCKGDPIAVAKQIKETYGIDVKIHVIAFDVKPEEKAQLQGIATAGGGNFYSADNAKALNDSLVEIKTETVSIAKKEDMSAGAQAVDENFDGSSLSENWEVMNEAPDSYYVGDGFLTVINETGSSENASIRNIFLYKGELPENYVMTVGFTMEIQDYRRNDSQYSGPVMFFDNETLLACLTQGNYDYGDGTRYLREAIYLKYAAKQRGEDFIKIINIGGVQDKRPTGETEFYFKIEKQKFKYTAFCSDNGSKWAELGSYTVIGKKLIPGIVAYRNSDGKETVTNFDFFKITELK